MWQKTEPFALPAELRAQIGTFYAKKVANFGFLKYSIFRGKSNKSDRKTGNRKSGRMCLAMDANRTLSQLSYGPFFLLIPGTFTCQQQKSLYHFFSICKEFFEKSRKIHPIFARRKKGRQLAAPSLIAQSMFCHPSPEDTLGPSHPALSVQCPPAVHRFAAQIRHRRE